MFLGGLWAMCYILESLCVPSPPPALTYIDMASGLAELRFEFRQSSKMVHILIYYSTLPFHFLHLNHPGNHIKRALITHLNYYGHINHGVLVSYDKALSIFISWENGANKSNNNTVHAIEANMGVIFCLWAEPQSTELDYSDKIQLSVKLF